MGHWYGQKKNNGIFSVKFIRLVAGGQAKKTF